MSKHQIIYKLRDFIEQDAICHDNYSLQESLAIDLLWQ